MINEPKEVVEEAEITEEDFGDIEVEVVDDLSTGSMENIEHLKNRRGFQYVIDSVTNEDLLAEQTDRCDVVFHLAAAVGVKLIVERPVHTIETNVHGTEVVLTQANKNSQKKKLVIVASTSEVYGKSTEIPFREDADLRLGATWKHRWAYACSKALDEFLALAYWKEKKLPVIVVRLFNTVGPRQTGQYGMVVPNFVKQALAPSLDQNRASLLSVDRVGSNMSMSGGLRFEYLPTGWHRRLSHCAMPIATKSRHLISTPCSTGMASAGWGA